MSEERKHTSAALYHTITGKILADLGVSTGTTKKGTQWERRDYLIETSKWYGTKMKFAVHSFDGPIAYPLQVGQEIELTFTVEAREYKDSWFNEVKAYRIDEPKQDLT